MQAFWLPQQFRIAFRPTSSANEVFWQSFDAEMAIWYPNAGFTKFQRDTLQAVSSLSWTNCPHKVFILPTESSNSSMTVPEDWIVVRLTKDNADMFDRLRKSSQIYANNGGVDLLIRDLRNDTNETVSRRWVVDSDLTCVRKLVKERLDAVRMLPRR
ncbi:hypothetical protein VNI00_012697 [Paramarasmius palmivorus]|uniref:Uncharacterized protein n=1 Tax=Paramarasmius palmivorus TaxID=297713 RepID=A0AAW0C3W9_9AGAR